MHPLWWLICQIPFLIYYPRESKVRQSRSVEEHKPWTRCEVKILDKMKPSYDYFPVCNMMMVLGIWGVRRGNICETLRKYLEHNKYHPPPKKMPIEEAPHPFLFLLGMYILPSIPTIGAISRTHTGENNVLFRLPGLTMWLNPIKDFI